MTEQTEFPERYKKLIDDNLAPDRDKDEEMRKRILRLMLSRDPPAS